MKVKTLKQLHNLALNKKAVTCRIYSKHKPASFVIGMPGRSILQLFEIGLFVYNKKGGVSNG